MKPCDTEHEEQPPEPVACVMVSLFFVVCLLCWLIDKATGRR